MDTRNEAWEKIVDALEKGDVEKLAELREILPDAVGDASRLLDALSFAAARPDRALIEATLHGLQEEFTQECRTRLAR